MALEQNEPVLCVVSIVPVFGTLLRNCRSNIDLQRLLRRCYLDRHLPDVLPRYQPAQISLLEQLPNWRHAVAGYVPVALRGPRTDVRTFRSRRESRPHVYERARPVPTPGQMRCHISGKRMAFGRRSLDTVVEG